MWSVEDLIYMLSLQYGGFCMECGVWQFECGVWNVEKCGVQNEERCGSLSNGWEQQERGKVSIYLTDPRFFDKFSQVKHVIIW